MAYPAVVIANEFIKMGIESGRLVDPMKVQKLVYLAHGWNLEFRGKPLIREDIEAWPYGPVVPSLYDTFKKYRSRDITEEAAVPRDSPTVDADTKAFLEKIWKTYGVRTSIELSMLTHEPGYAWDLARKGCEGGWSSPEINEKLIRDEFNRRKRASL